MDGLIVTTIDRTQDFRTTVLVLVSASDRDATVVGTIADSVADSVAVLAAVGSG